MNPLDVVLTPPQRERLRRTLELPDLAGVVLTAEGWHRFAILTTGRVLLLPRSHRWVPGLDREAAALEVLHRAGVPAPRLLDRIDDPELWPYPVNVVSRCRARSWAAYQDAATGEQVTELLTGLARVIAAYHSIDVAALPSIIAVPPPASPDPFEAELRHFEDYLEPGRLEKIGYALAAAAGLSGGRVGRWLATVQPLLQLAPTFVHRDINEGQILIAPGRRAQPVSALIDWESSGVQHPLSDFDFGEWGPGIWDWEPQFAQLRRAFWDGYAAARGIELPDWRAMHLLMTIIGAPPPEGLGTAWNDQRRARTISNLREIDALL